MNNSADCPTDERSNEHLKHFARGSSAKGIATFPFNSNPEAGLFSAPCNGQYDVSGELDICFGRGFRRQCRQYQHNTDETDDCNDREPDIEASGLHLEPSDDRRADAATNCAGHADCSNATRSTPAFEVRRG